MDSDSEVLLTRALNATRTTYQVSYAALRILADRLPKAASSDFLPRLLHRHWMAAESWRYRRFRSYKGINSRGSVDYRECIAPSALTAVAEAVILRKLSESSAFAVNPHVYSYLWPRSSRGGRNFQFFADGYHRRNADISAILDTEPQDVAFITDIRAFYPSVDRNTVHRALAGRVNGAPDLGNQAERDAILHFFSDVLRQSPGGIPVGPESGHVLGHLALEVRQ
jgi:hypothetical protein